MRSTLAGALVLSMTVQSLAAAGIAAGSKVSWRKVWQLPAGTTITVTAAGTSPQSCYVLLADDTTLRVLSISDLRLALETVKLLRRTAAEHPASFIAGPGTALELGGQVVLRSSGLSVAGKKVADYDRVVQTVARGDVETGAVLLGDAPVHKGMEGSTQIVLVAGISLAVYLAIYLVGKSMK